MATLIGAMSQERISVSLAAMAAKLVNGAGQISAMRKRNGGLAGWMTRKRSRPGRSDANCDIGMKDEELAIAQSSPASPAKAENTSRLLSRSSGVHSWT